MYECFPMKNEWRYCSVPDWFHRWTHIEINVSKWVEPGVQTLYTSINADTIWM